MEIEAGNFVAFVDDYVRLAYKITNAPLLVIKTNTYAIHCYDPSCHQSRTLSQDGIVKLVTYPVPYNVDQVIEYYNAV